MPKTVLLVTTVGWPSVPRYAAGFAAAGCRVEAFAPPGAPVAQSRYVARHHAYEPFLPLQSLRRAVEDSAPGLLVACDDRAVTHLLKLHESGGAIADLIARSLGDVMAYGGMMSRAACLSAMKDMGVRVPDTFAAVDDRELDAALDRIGFPAVVKSDGSWGGEGVIVANDRAAAQAAFRKLSLPPSRLRSLVRSLRRRDAHFLIDAIRPQTRAISVQRYVEGTPAASAFAAWRGEVVGLIAYDVLVADATIGPPNVIRRVDCPEMEAATRAAAKRFGLSGLHGLDFIRDRDGKVHLLEINPRGTQGGTLAFGPGRDLPAALANAAFGNVAGMRRAIANDTVVLFPRQWRNDPTSDWLKRGHHDVPWDDPAVLRAALGVSGR